jgi:hypothetical protein
MGLGFNGCFMAGVVLTGGHYRMKIISGVGHSRLDSVVPLVLCTVAYNIRGTGVVLQVFETTPTLMEMGNISGRPYY